MRHAPVARIEDHPAASLHVLGQGKWRKTRGKRDGRRIGLDLDPAVRNPDLAQALGLVLSEYLKGIDAPAPEICQPQQRAEPNTAPAALGDQTLGMEIHDAVDEPPSQHNVQRRDEVQQQRRASGKENKVGGPHRGESHRAATPGSKQSSRSAARQTAAFDTCVDAPERFQPIPPPPARPTRANSLRWLDRPASPQIRVLPTRAPPPRRTGRPLRSPAAASRRYRPGALTFGIVNWARYRTSGESLHPAPTNILKGDRKPPSLTPPARVPDGRPTREPWLP